MLAAENLFAETIDVELQLCGMNQQVLVLQLMLTLEEEVVHLPEAALGSGCLGCLSRPLREGMHVVTREVTENETHLIREVFDDLTDQMVGPSASRALELAVLDKRHRRDPSPTNMVAVPDGIEQVQRSLT